MSTRAWSPSPEQSHAAGVLLALSSRGALADAVLHELGSVVLERDLDVPTWPLRKVGPVPVAPGLVRRVVRGALASALKPQRARLGVSWVKNNGKIDECWVPARSEPGRFARWLRAWCLRVIDEMVGPDAGSGPRRRSRARRAEILLDVGAIEKRTGPWARDGHAWKRPVRERAGSSEREQLDRQWVHRPEAIRASVGPEVKRQKQRAIEEYLATRGPTRMAPGPSPSERKVHGRSEGVDPVARSPGERKRGGKRWWTSWEDPEKPDASYSRGEARERFCASLDPTERKVFDHPSSDSPEDVAARVGTTASTVESLRAQIRKKAKAWTEREAAETTDETTNPRRAQAARRDGSETRSAIMMKPWGRDREVLGLVRRMTPEELADMHAGYPASRYRRRSAARGRSTDGRGEVGDAEITIVRKAA